MTATREQWLIAGIDALREHFKDVGYVVPKKVRVSVGFPRGARKAIGQCWKQASAADGASHIFISPTLSTAFDVLDTLAHELVHAAIDPVTGHGAEFAKACKAVGLTQGKPTSAGAGPELGKLLKSIATKLGKYPHAALNPRDVVKQTTRLLKVECGDCGYVVRVTRKWLDDAGAPLCPCNREPMEESK